MSLPGVSREGAVLVSNVCLIVANRVVSLPGVSLEGALLVSAGFLYLYI